MSQPEDRGKPEKPPKPETPEKRMRRQYPNATARLDRWEGMTGEQRLERLLSRLERIQARQRPVEQFGRQAGAMARLRDTLRKLGRDA